MDSSGGMGQNSQHRKPRSGRRPQYDQYGTYGYQQPAGGQPTGPQLFDDTSLNYQGQHAGSVPPPQGPGAMYNFPNQMFTDPMIANVAMQYGQSLMGQGKDIVDQKLEKYVSVSQLKYFFAVDNHYVLKKLGLLFFPFTNRDWAIKYNLDEPIAPRHEVNAADLYIPLMAFCTYVLAAGIALGVQNRFAPEQLGIIASSALGWLLIEVIIVMLMFYVFSLNTKLSTYHTVAFLSYKYVGMVSCLVAYTFLKSLGYYVFLVYCSLSLAFFLTRAMRSYMPIEASAAGFSSGTKRKKYLVLIIAAVQPLMMLYLTSHLTVRQPIPVAAQTIGGL